MAHRLQVVGIEYALPGSKDLLLANVCFDTEGDSRVAIFGRSGVGKTTLFRILAGLEKSHEGRVLLGGRAVDQMRVGYCFQDRQLMPWATLRDNVEYAETPSRQLAEHFIEKLGLSDVADRKAVDASGGEQARCAIARALVSEPDILLLDEPMNGLDERARRQLIRDLLTVQAESQFLMLLITHDMSEVETLCERVHVLSGRPATITATLRVQDIDRETLHNFADDSSN